MQRWVAWRLLAGNGWEIARSASVFPDAAACRAAIDVLTDTLARADWTTTRADRLAAWSWEITVDGNLAAVASRFYKLPRECESAVRTFLNLLPRAVLPQIWGDAPSPTINNRPQAGASSSSSDGLL